MNDLPGDLANKAAPISLDGNTKVLLVIVAGVALLFVVYLLVDFVRARLQARRLERKKRMAREVWQNRTGP